MTDDVDGLKLDKLLLSGQYSDLTLVCDGQEFKVHKAIVCSQSPVLAAEINGHFKEAATGTIEIKQFRPETVKQMVQFLYTGDYDCEGQDQEVSGDDETDSQSAMDDKLHQHVRVNTIADYYDMPKLGKRSRENIDHESSLGNVGETFLEAAKEALATNGDVHLHEMLAEIAASNIQLLYDKEGFSDLCTDFSAKIISDMAERLASMDLGIRGLQTKLRLAEADKESASSRLDGEINDHRETLRTMRACHQTLKSTKMCRNVRCEVDFQCYVEEKRKGNGELGLTLTCAKCRCKHT